jgi:hypothetical protein
MINEWDQYKKKDYVKWSPGAVTVGKKEEMKVVSL